MTRLLSILLSMLFCAEILSAATPLSYDGGDLPKKILPSRHFYFHQSHHDLLPDEWKSLNWIDASQSPFRTEQGAHYQWVKFSVKNETNTVQESILYHASNMTLENMEVYRLTEGKLILIGQSGAAMQVRERSIRQRIIAAHLNLDPGQTVDLMVHTHTTRPFKPDFAITSEDDFNEYIQTRNLLNGFCMGIHSIVFLISAAFAYRLRDRTYGWFAVMALSMIALIIVSFGYKDASEFFSRFPISSTDLGKIIRPGTTMMILNHTAVFLALRTGMPILFQWFQATMISLATLIALSFTSGVSNFAIAGADRLIFVGMILMAIASFKAWRQKIPQGGYFLIATLCLIVSVIPWLVVQIFALSVPRLALDMIPIGQAVQMSLLTIGLAAKVRSIDEARTKAEIEAGKNEELKSLVRVLSHDLSNPISVVIAYAQKGISKCYDHKLPDISQYFEKILKSSENQVAIIDHIKVMRAIQDGKSSIHLTNVPLLSVLKQAESTFEEALLNKNLRLVYDRNAISDLTVIADASSLNHNVINNFISNAIKFSHAGGAIEITTQESGEFIKLTIADQGIGIPKEMMENIFRADKPTSRTGTMGEKGVGYGMPLAQSFIKKYGGDITIESATEAESPARHGTRVTVSLKKAA